MNLELFHAEQALLSGDLDAAERLLRAHLTARPGDVNALLLMAALNAQAGRLEAACVLLRRTVVLAPDVLQAWRQLAVVLMRLDRPHEARDAVLHIMEKDATNLDSRRLLAAIQHACGDHVEAGEVYAGLTHDEPNRVSTWVEYGNVLRTIGLGQEAATSYRRAIALAPECGDGYWGLANLKSAQFSDAEVEQLRAQLKSPGHRAPDAVSMFFALGYALHQRGDASGAFASFAEGATIRRSYDKYDASALSALITASRDVFRECVFTARAGVGCPAQDPIFVVGMPRSGSTLVEHILASHSQVEGTKELADLPSIALSMAESGAASDYNWFLSCEEARFAELGERYMRASRKHRKTDRLLFVDKALGNWMYVGLIQLILPNAKIIDVRRHPMACGWSCFKQHFPKGHAFTYDLVDIGRAYVDYVGLMDHWDAVLPGRVHRVLYEDLVSDPEKQIRAMLSHCGLAFESQCLRPHQTTRPVRTASAEQVRRPITAAWIDEWRTFESELEPLRQALGIVLTTYARAPNRRVTE